MVRLWLILVSSSTSSCWLIRAAEVARRHGCTDDIWTKRTGNMQPSCADGIRIKGGSQLTRKKRSPPGHNLNSRLGYRLKKQRGGRQQSRSILFRSMTELSSQELIARRLKEWIDHHCRKRLCHGPRAVWCFLWFIMLDSCLEIYLSLGVQPNGRSHAVPACAIGSQTKEAARCSKGGGENERCHDSQHHIRSYISFSH